MDDYMDGVLGHATKDELQKHVAICPDCRERLTREQVLKSALKAMPAPAPDPDFVARAFERAAAAHNRHPRINASVLMRIAASIIVIFTFGLMFKSTWRPDRSELPVAFVKSNQPEEIRLVFNSGQALENVTLRLKMPQGVELVGFEEQREVVWQTNLVQGENMLVLPVIVRDREGGSLISEIRHGNQSKRFKLHIKVLRPEDPASGAGRIEGRRISTTT
jgi:hypothetical protein